MRRITRTGAMWEKSILSSEAHMRCRTVHGKGPTPDLVADNIAGALNYRVEHDGEADPVCDAVDDLLDSEARRQVLWNLTWGATASEEAEG